MLKLPRTHLFPIYRLVLSFDNFRPPCMDLFVCFYVSVMLRSSIASSLYPNTSLSTLHCRSCIGRCPPPLNFTSPLKSLLHLPSHSPICNRVWRTQSALRALGVGRPCDLASPLKSFLLGSQARLPLRFPLWSRRHPCFGLCLRLLPLLSFFFSLFPACFPSFFLLSLLSPPLLSPCFFSASVKATDVIISHPFPASPSTSVHPPVRLQLSPEHLPPQAWTRQCPSLALLPFQVILSPASPSIG